MVLLHNKLSLGLAPADTRVHNSYPFNDSDQIYPDKKLMQTDQHIDIRMLPHISDIDIPTLRSLFSLRLTRGVMLRHDRTEGWLEILGAVSSDP